MAAHPASQPMSAQVSLCTPLILLIALMGVRPAMGAVGSTRGDVSQPLHNANRLCGVFFHSFPNDLPEKAFTPCLQRDGGGVRGVPRRRGAAPWSEIRCQEIGPRCPDHFLPSYLFSPSWPCACGFISPPSMHQCTSPSHANQIALHNLCCKHIVFSVSTKISALLAIHCGCIVFKAFCFPLVQVVRPSSSYLFGSTTC